jgi:thiol-disulfide isomerase/thioredoxin
MNRSFLLVAAAAVAACSNAPTSAHAPASHDAATTRTPEVAPTAASPANPTPAVEVEVARTKPESTAAEKPTKAQPGEAIPAFRGTVRHGVESAAFDSRGTNAPTVYIVDSPTCPTCVTYAPRVVELEKAYSAKGVKFVHVYPKLSAMVAWHDKEGFVGGELLDADASITKALAADRTPTVVVADAKGVVAYRGAIDDARNPAKVQTRYLAEALDAVLANGPVPHASTPPVG